MKAILCAILIGLSLIGSAAAVVDVNTFDTDYSEWLGFSLANLAFETPAFASGWANTTASATFDPEVYGSEGLKPYAIADIVFSDPNGATVLNLPNDPDATLNFTVVSTSGLGLDSIQTADVKTGTQNFDSYASAAGVAYTDVVATRNAWTAAAFDVNTVVTPTTSTASVVGSASAIADLNFNLNPFNP
jgi:hypothetical protein